MNEILLSITNNVHYILPGFISLKVWERIHPSKEFRFAEYTFEVIFYSLFNYFITTKLFDSLSNEIIKLGLIYIIFPVLWPILLKLFFRLVSKINLLKNNIINPIPKAWDYYFEKRKNCFVIVYLKNGNIVYGFYGDNSFASSYPENEDLYIQEVYDIQGMPIQDTDGILIKSDSIDYIEFRKINITNNKYERKKICHISLKKVINLPCKIISKCKEK